MPIDLTDIIVIIAAAQGFLLAALILQKYRKLYANRFLAASIIAYSVIMLHLIAWESSLYFSYPFLILIPAGLPFLIGPLNYLYSLYLLGQSSGTKMKRNDLLHFIPFALYLLYLASSFILFPSTVVNALRSAETDNPQLNFVLFDWAISVQGLIYMLLTLSIIKRYEQETREVFSSLDKTRISWLKNITYMGLSAIAIFSLENLLSLFGITVSVNFNLSSSISALYICLLGYLGLLKSEIFLEPEVSEVTERINESAEKEESGSLQKGAQSKTIAIGKYEKSGLTEENASLYTARLLRLMDEEKPYKESELTLNRLAEMTGISPHNLSEIINMRIKQNFFDFVNSYRVEEVKRALRDPEQQSLKILAIAMDAGFNSKGAFNTIFKKYTGITPSEYRRQASAEMPINEKGKPENGIK